MASNDAEQLSRLLRGHWTAQAIHVAARLKIADLLKDGPLSVKELAGLTNCHEPHLYRLLRALASLGIFSEEIGAENHGSFRLTPLADCLQSDLPGSLWAMAVMVGEHFQAWGH